jgi:hypothetical protein
LQNSDRSHIIDLHPFILVLNPPLFSIPKTLLFLLDYSFTHAITTTKKQTHHPSSLERASERSPRPRSRNYIKKKHRKNLHNTHQKRCCEVDNKRGTSEPKKQRTIQNNKEKAHFDEKRKERERERRSLALFVEFNNR